VATVAVGVAVWVLVGVLMGWVAVAVAVFVITAVSVAVAASVAVAVDVLVAVPVAVGVDVGVLVAVFVAVGKIIGVSNWPGVGGKVALGVGLLPGVLVGTAVKVPGGATSVAVFDGVGEITTGSVGGSSADGVSGAMSSKATPTT
jgi:hypothetical protein